MITTPATRPERPGESLDGPNGAAAETTSLSPTITHYQQLAEEASALIEQIVTILPKLELPHPTTTRFVRAHRNVPLAFIEKAVASVAEKKSLQAVNKLDVVFGWDTLQLNQAFRPMVDNLFNFAMTLKYTLDSRLAILAADALQIYYLTKGLGRDPGGADMLQLAADFKRLLGHRGPRKKDATSDPQAPTAGPVTEPAPARP